MTGVSDMRLAITKNAHTPDHRISRAKITNLNPLHANTQKVQIHTNLHVIILIIIIIIILHNYKNVFIIIHLTQTTKQVYV